MAVVLLLIIFACTILQKLFFKYIFRNADSEDESYAAKKKRRKMEKAKVKAARAQGKEV
jgi:multiple sugar transport system permease protein